MIPFIDFHTHKQYSGNSRIVSLIHLNPSDKVPDNYFSVGIHPWHVNQFHEKDWRLLMEKAVQPDCLAIGEAGLERTSNFINSFERQKKLFIRQMELSIQLGKPMIIHCVKCYDELLRLKKDQKQIWIVHGFSKSYEMARQLIRKNIIPSFGRLIFNTDTKAFKALSLLNLNEFVLETDDSDVRIEEIYKQASAVKNIPVDNLKEIMAFQFERIFKKSVFS